MHYQQFDSSWRRRHCLSWNQVQTSGGDVRYLSSLLQIGMVPAAYKPKHRGESQAAQCGLPTRCIGFDKLDKAKLVGPVGRWTQRKRLRCCSIVTVLGRS